MKTNIYTIFAEEGDKNHAVAWFFTPEEAETKIKDYQKNGGIFYIKEWSAELTHVKDYVPKL